MTKKEFVSLTVDQARELSGTKMWKHLDVLNKKALSGSFVSSQEKMEALNMPMPLFGSLIKGQHTKEEVAEMIKEWKEYFSSTHVEIYNKHIKTIESIEEMVS